VEPLFQKRRIAFHRGGFFRRHPAKKQGLISLFPFQSPVQFIIGLRFRACEFGQISDPEMLMLCPLMDKKILYSPQRPHDCYRRAQLFTDLSYESLRSTFAEMDTPSGKDPEIISTDRVKKGLFATSYECCSAEVECLIVPDKRDHKYRTVSTEP